MFPHAPRKAIESAAMKQFDQKIPLWFQVVHRKLQGQLRKLDRARLIEARYSRPWQQYYVGAELAFGRDVFGDSYSRVRAFVRF